MLIRKPTSLSELHSCVDLYIPMNDESFLVSDASFCRRSLEVHWKRGDFIHLCEEDDRVVGFLVGIITKNYHFPGLVCQQLYYASNLKGISAARALRLLHDALFDYATEHRVPVVLSQGSHMDEKFVMARLLEGYGWERRGFLALRKTPFYQPYNRRLDGQDGHQQADPEPSE